MRGLAMTNCDQIRDVHNSFVRPESFLADESAKRAATEDDDLFHFISYVPVNGRLYELDGLRESPVDHGRTDDWLESVGPVIQRRMAEYAEGEIRFNLMAVIGDRRKMLGERVSTIDASIGRLLKKLEAMNISPSSASTPAGGAGAVEDAEVARLRSQIGRLNVERADLEHLVELEHGKRARYRFDNSLRKHNFIPMVYQLVRAMAQKGALAEAMQKAQQSPSASG
ncbi:ubiquitin carboxyl-terminal hydrolase [Kickxella alabastrina]|uniref:Ubiquitin carboxyl-terminal hydrolase n=1 Tax=Kickxella alabastrina TaxID=61397 RepID=A0ACC1I0I8_9FUNG|nr:ubiquitin carboxyl-terminal hydrolase [Kickxella alabastrina]